MGSAACARTWPPPSRANPVATICSQRDVTETCQLVRRRGRLRLVRPGPNTESGKGSAQNQTLVLFGDSIYIRL